MTPPRLPGSAEAGEASTRPRCVRHVEREAVAQCRACGGAFCRECVVPHVGRLLCGPCLARVTQPTLAGGVGANGRRWRRGRRLAATLLGAALVWAVFHVVAGWLARVPRAVHDGTIWRAEGTK